MNKKLIVTDIFLFIYLYIYTFDSKDVGENVNRPGFYYFSQGFYQLLEPKVTVRCRKQDLQMVQVSKSAT